MGEISKVLHLLALDSLTVSERQEINVSELSLNEKFELITSQRSSEAGNSYIPGRCK